MPRNRGGFKLSEVVFDTDIPSVQKNIGDRIVGIQSASRSRTNSPNAVLAIEVPDGLHFANTIMARWNPVEKVRAIGGCQRDLLDRIAGDSID